MKNIKMLKEELKFLMDLKSIPTMSEASNNFRIIPPLDKKKK